MSTGNANTSPAKYVTCPKCYGAKYFSCWSHIFGGACFCCAGNGDVEINRALEFGYTGPEAPVVAPGKPVKLAAPFNDGWVTKVNDNGQTWFHLTFDGPCAETAHITGGAADFQIQGGKIVNLTANLSTTRRGEVPALVAALQSAMKKG